MSEEKPQDPQMNVELSDQIAEGIYSNLAILNHSHSEFIVDFIQMMPGLPKARVKARVILTPAHAKRLLKALGENIQKYEQQFGEIKHADPPTIPLNFGGPAGQA